MSEFKISSTGETIKTVPLEPSLLKELNLINFLLNNFGEIENEEMVLLISKCVFY